VSHSCHLVLKQSIWNCRTRRARRFVKDFSKGLIAVRVGAVQLIDIKGWLKIESPELRVYNLISAGERYGYRPTGPFAIAVIVDAKWDLYLAAKQADGTLKRIERQPNGFPIASE